MRSGKRTGMIRRLLRCALSLAAVGALAPAAAPDTRPRIGLALLTAWAVCSGLLAFFADDLEGQPPHGSGIVHLVLAFIAFACVTIATVVISAGLRRDPRWNRVRTVLLAVSLAGVVAFLLLGSATGHKHAPGGLYERIFLGLELLWIAVAAAHIATMRSPRSGRTARDARDAQAALPAARRMRGSA
jgi:Protein of unknown function (DUF998)